MYLDFRKIAQWFGTLLGVIALGFGLVSFVFSATVTEQIAATLAAIFGLMVVWFMAWLRDGNPPPKLKVAPKPVRPADPEDKWRRY